MAKDIYLRSGPNDFHLIIDGNEIEDVLAIDLKIDSHVCRVTVQIEVLNMVTVQTEIQEPKSLQFPEQ